MTARRPPSLRDPNNYGQRLANGLRAMSKGSDGGRVLNASPITTTGGAGTSGDAPDLDLSPGGDGGLVGFVHQRFPSTGTLAGTETALALTAQPVHDSLHLYLNGFEQDEGTDYTLSGTTVSILTAMGIAAGDVIDTRYASDGTNSAAAVTVAGVVLWKFDETSGTVAADSSGNSNDGTYHGTPGFSQTSLLASGLGYSVLFSGDDSVDIAYGAWMNSASLTMEAFIKTTSGGAVWDRDDLNFFTDRVFQMRVNAGKLEFINIAGSVQTVTGAVTVNDGVKHHVAVTVDGTTIRLYVDGVADTSAAQAAALRQPTTTRLALGRNNAGGGGSDTNFFVGNIDQAAYYAGQVLTATEIAARAAQ